MNPRLVARAHTDGTWAYSRRTERKNGSLEPKEQPCNGGPLFSFDDRSCSLSCCEYISVVFAGWCLPLWGGAQRDQEDCQWQETVGTSSRAAGSGLRSS